MFIAFLKKELWLGLCSFLLKQTVHLFTSKLKIRIFSPQLLKSGILNYTYNVCIYYTYNVYI